MKKSKMLLLLLMPLIAACGEDVSNTPSLESVVPSESVKPSESIDSSDSQTQDSTHTLLDHKFVNESIVVEATCTQEGSKILYCECGAYIEEKIPTLVHKYNYTTTKEATCTSNEELKGVCEYCGDEVIKTELNMLAHNYVYKTIQEPTCYENEIIEGTCSVCNDKVVQEGKALGHHFEDYEITVQPTTTNEGFMVAKCSNGCNEQRSFKLLQTPVATRNGLNVTWTNIPNASGYVLYNFGKEFKDVGNTLTYTLPVEDGSSYSIEVLAYTDNENYFGNSAKSNVINASLSLSNNMQEGCGTDFEGFKLTDATTIDITSVWQKNYSNHSGQSVTIIKDDNNIYAKLKSSSTSFSSITHAANTSMLKAGTYVVSIDVKLGSAFDGTVASGLYNGNAWVYSRNNKTIDVSTANSSTWTTVTYEYTLTEDKTGSYSNLDFGHKPNTVSEDNYILIDNIDVRLKGSDTNLERKNNYNFEEFFQHNLNSSGWHSDGTQDVVYISEDSVENSFITIDNNSVFKAYTSNRIFTNANFNGNEKIATAGLYQLTIKVKGGPDANRLGSIGFRMFGESFKVVDVRFDGVENINSETWTTLKAVFEVKATKVTSYVNIEIYVYTNNDLNSSVDNYVLIDDLSVYKIQIQ